MPGALGHEPARVHAVSALVGNLLPAGPTQAAQPSAQRGFFTRVFSELRFAAGQQWGERNGLGGNLPFSHNLTRVFPPELYKTHPEFFPLEGVKRIQPPKGSYFWNPDIARADVARYAAESARKHFSLRPDAVSFPLGVNDALIWGESLELLALATPVRWFRERPDYSNVVFTFMNRAAEELSLTHPDKYLGALAYYWCENVPGFPLHPQVIPFLTADRSQGYDTSFWREEMGLQARWGAAAGGPPQLSEESYRLFAGTPNHFQRVTNNGGTGAAPPRRLGLYDYLYGGGFLIPRLHTKLLAENLRHARKAGFTDYYAEVYPNWGLDGITPWLTAQLVQDPEQSAEALLDEYYRRYFRESAQPMRRFYERCEEQWMQQPGPAYWLKHYRNESQAIVFPSEVCRELRETLDQAVEQARSARVRARVRLVSDAFGVTERLVEFNEARAQLLRLALQGGGGEAREEAIAGALKRYLEARRDFIHYTVSLQKTQPLALHPFLWDDYLKNDPVPTALFALRTARADGGGRGAGGRAEAWSKIGGHSSVAALWPAIVEAPEMPGSREPGVGKELLHDAEMAGALLPARSMAGLPYGVSLPAGWQSRVEPAHYHRGVLLEGKGGRVLRIERTKDTTVSQWCQPVEGGVYRGRIAVRGRVSPGAAVSLIFAWLDSQHRHMGFKAVRLPDGDWPEWVTLRQAGHPPKGAVWVGLGLRVQNQVEGDWVEAKGFSLAELSATDR